MLMPSQGKFTIIKECVKIEDGTVIAPNTVIPPFSLVAGRPGVVVEELPETTPEMLDRMCHPSSYLRANVTSGQYSQGCLSSNISFRRFLRIRYYVIFGPSVECISYPLATDFMFIISHR